jgi:PIN domain nuclease of toxin-antitoxin system
LLLDTQVVIVAAQAPERLSARVRDALLDRTVQRFVSLVSLWEIAIKRGTGKLTMGESDLDQTLIDLAADEMTISRRHVLGVAELPLHHRDPFDRLLIAQAKAEDLIIATSDRYFAAYEVRILPA